jgi:hypothetical protein
MSSAKSSASRAVRGVTARLDCIYVAASARDARYTRICVASIRHFYPDTPIKLLAGGQEEEGLAGELARYWDVGRSDIGHRDWGWGFVKLEPLFGRSGERFMVVDSDTAFAGRVLATWAASSADFLVDDERQSEADLQRLYYDWRKVAAIDPAARPPQFVFNSGQWFGTAGVLTRKDFALLVEWSSTSSPHLRHPGLFMPGEQGVLNYVLNQKAMLDGISVDQRKIMRWPGHGLDGISAQSVAERSAPPLVVHWAGMKEPRLGAMAGADILGFFEKLYYSRLPAARARHFWAGIKYPAVEWRHNLSLRIRQRLRMITARSAQRAA